MTGRTGLTGRRAMPGESAQRSGHSWPAPSLVAISFAMLIFSGPLSSQMSRGIGLALAGSLIFALWATLFGAGSGVMWRIGGATVAPLAASVTHLVAVMDGFPVRSVFATAVALIICSTMLTGLVLYVFGALRLGHAARFVPYPVLGGFLAAIGTLLIIKGIALGAGPPSGSESGLARLLTVEAAWKWVPPFVLGAVLAVLSQRSRVRLALPIGVIVYLLVFYAVIGFVPGGLGWAARSDLLFADRLPAHGGPLLTDIAALAHHVNGHALVGAIPTMLTVPAVALFACVMGIAGLSASAEPGLELNREMRRAGLANLVAGIVGSPPGYQSASTTYLASSLSGRPGRLTAVAAVIVIALFLAGGVVLVPMLPTGLFALILVYVGGCMSYRWLWQALRQMPHKDYAVILLMLGTTLRFGFVTAILVGLILAALLFVVAYSRIDVVRSETTGRVRRSATERSEAAERLLASRGDQTLIIELQGFLFFGTASRLSDRLSARIIETDQRARWVIIGFRRVHGVDVSAAFMLARIVRAASESGVGIIFTGISDRLAGELGRSDVLVHAEMLLTLDDGLTRAEEQILARSRFRDEGPGGFAAMLSQAQASAGGTTLSADA